ncbi:MAG: hypothetical protein AAB558_03190 [Patescibacteria group bacterium]
MDQTHTSLPFDPDFDTDSSQAHGAQTTPTQTTQPKLKSELAGIHPLMAFYAGLACSVLVFGLAGIIFLLTQLN